MEAKILLCADKNARKIEKYCKIAQVSASGCSAPFANSESVVIRSRYNEDSFRCAKKNVRGMASSIQVRKEKELKIILRRFGKNFLYKIRQRGSRFNRCASGTLTNKNGGVYEVLSCKTKTSIRRFKKRLYDESREGGLWKSALFCLKTVCIRIRKIPNGTGRGRIKCDG